MVEQRSRTYGFILYPESMPKNWQEILSELHIPCAISPLHDSDFTEDGEPKKPHYHGVLYFDGKKSVAQVIACLNPLGVEYVEQIANTRSYNRYLCHLDNPEKAQYAREDVLTFCGAVVDMSVPLTPEQRAAQRNTVITFVIENNIVEYADLVEYSLMNEPDWLDYVESHTIFLNGYIRSRRCSVGYTGDDEKTQ